MNQKLILASIMIVLLVFSAYSYATTYDAYGARKGTHLSPQTKAKISHELKMYHATGLTKKQRGEK
jgi:hypothetical protein